MPFVRKPGNKARADQPPENDRQNHEKGAVMEPRDPQQGPASVAGPFALQQRHGSPSSRTTSQVLGELGQLWTPVLAANFRKAGVPQPPGLGTDADFYRDAPVSVRRQHSL